MTRWHGHLLFPVGKAPRVCRIRQAFLFTFGESPVNLSSRTLPNVQHGRQDTIPKGSISTMVHGVDASLGEAIFGWPCRLGHVTSMCPIEGLSFLRLNLSISWITWIQSLTRSDEHSLWFSCASKDHKAMRGKILKIQTRQNLSQEMTDCIFVILPVVWVAGQVKGGYLQYLHHTLTRCAWSTRDNVIRGGPIQVTRYHKFGYPTINANKTARELIFQWYSWLLFARECPFFQQVLASLLAETATQGKGDRLITETPPWAKWLAWATKKKGSRNNRHVPSIGENWVVLFQQVLLLLPGVKHET